MKRVKKWRKHNIFIYAERQQKNIEYVLVQHEYYTMCWHGQMREECIRSHVDDVLAGDSSSRVLKLLPVRRLSPVQMLKQAWMLIHTVFNTTKERNQGMMGNEKGHTQGINWSVEHAQTKTMKVELCDGRISSQRLHDSSSGSSRGASEQ